MKCVTHMSPIESLCCLFTGAVNANVNAIHIHIHFNLIMLLRCRSTVIKFLVPGPEASPACEK